MFSALQQRTWTTSHLTGGAWYLDCPPSFIPSFETGLRKSREVVGESEIEMLDLQGIEDENEKAKEIKRCIKEDLKKAMRVKEAEERADQKKREKLQKSLEKSTKKGRKK
jgi:DNA-binding transcriptional regulator GbsR (MarR family)